MTPPVRSLRRHTVRTQKKSVQTASIAKKRTRRAVKQAHAERPPTAKVWERTTERLEVILQSISDGITVQDGTGSVVYANMAAATLVGFPGIEAFMQASIQDIMSRFELFDEKNRPLSVADLPGRLALKGQKAETIIRFRILKTGESRWSHVKSSPVYDEDSGRVLYAINIFQDITDKRRREDQEHFLLKASDILSSSLDYETTLKSIAKLTVPELADWCTIHMKDADGTVRQLAVMHADPQKIRWAQEMGRRYPSDYTREDGVGGVMRTGKAAFFSDIPDHLLEKAAKDKQHLRLLRLLGMKSVMMIPITARGRTLGAITFIAAESGRRYTQKDLAFFQEVANRAALAVDNALLFTDVQDVLHHTEQTRALLDTLQMAAPVGLGFVDEHLKVVRINDSLAAMSGLASGDMIGRTITGILPAFAEEAEQKFREVLRTGQPALNIEISGISPASGDHRFWMANYYPVHIQGKVTGVGVVIADITDRKRVEEVIRQREEQYRLMAETIPNIVWMTKSDGKIEYYNRRWYDYTGLTEEQTMTQGVKSVLHPDDYVECQRRWNHAMKTGTIYEIEYRMRRAADGSYRWHLGRALPVRDVSGHIIRWFGSATDIHDQRVAVEKIRALNTELEQKVDERTYELSEARKQDGANLERLKSMLSTMPFGALVADEDKKIIHANQQFCDIFRFHTKSESFLGKTHDYIIERVSAVAFKPDEYEAAIRSTLNAGELILNEEIYLCDGRTVLRDYLPVSVAGKPIGYVFLYRDVTQERRIDAIKSEFMSLASHQLRTPLTAIRWSFGRLSKMLEGKMQPVEQRLIQEGKNAIKRMADTINTMLAISRIESGQVTLAPTKIDLPQFLREIIASHETMATSRGQSLILDSAHSIAVESDISFLKEILNNLLTNAIKYTPENGRITLRCDHVADDVRIDIIDTGYGIPVHQQEQVFRKFFRGENVVQRDTEGTGLGLYLVSLLMKTLAGSITFSSVEGKGTTFSLVLPVRMGK